MSRRDVYRQTWFVIFQQQCGWFCWSLCVYELNSRLKCQIYHFGILNQRQQGAYFFSVKMKHLFTELFRCICFQVVSRMNVSGWVNCEMLLWRVFLRVQVSICAAQRWVTLINIWIEVFFFFSKINVFILLLKGPSCPTTGAVRMAACAASPGAEAKCGGFHPLESIIEGQLQDERWPLGGKKGGAGT